MLLATFLTLLVTAVTLAIAARRRIHRAVVGLVAAFVGSGLFIGSIPGALILICLIAVSASGPSSGTSWALWTTLAPLGTLSGVALGAYGAGAVSRPHVNRVALRAASTAVFAIVGVALSTAVLLATPKESTSGGLFSILCALITATSVLGFVVPKR
jgi:hypothetical protein